MWILGFAGETEVFLSSIYNGAIYPRKQGKELLSILYLNIMCMFNIFKYCHIVF